jgi:protoheme IX farnesyltransferase
MTRTRSSKPMTQHLNTVTPNNTSSRHAALAYWEVLKPRVTVLLTFLGAAAAVAASGSDPDRVGRVMIITIAVFFGSGGANGLTNYLDRSLDAKMRRTQGRAIPSGRISDPRYALYWSMAWAAVGIAIGFSLHPLVGIAGIVGVIASVVFRKTEATHFLGAIASTSPVAAGWLAMDPNIGVAFVALIAFVAAWVVHHVWAIMLFYSPDYAQAGINMFPLRSGFERTMPVFLILAIALIGMGLILGIAYDAGWGFFAISGTFAAYNLWGTTQLGRMKLTQAIRRRRFKTASYSLLCGVFTALVLDSFISATAAI